MTTVNAAPITVSRSDIRREDIPDRESNPRDYLFQDKGRLAEDTARLKAWQDGEWHFIGIRAAVTISVNGISQELTSAGLWGVESDSDENYLAEIFAEQRAELESILAALGIIVTDD